MHVEEKWKQRQKSLLLHKNVFQPFLLRIFANRAAACLLADQGREKQMQLPVTVSESKKTTKLPQLKREKKKKKKKLP